MPRKMVPCSDCGDPRPVGRGSLTVPTCRPCRELARHAECAECGVPFVRAVTDRRTRMHCDAHHRRITGYQLCKHCGAAFVRTKPFSQTRQHCDDCMAKSVWIKGVRRGGLSSGLNVRQRIAKFGVERERVVKRKVYDRDGWRCGICRKPVDRALPYPHRMSASLDHVVPISEGGGHTYANTQCAHWICNVKKGARGDSQQLALIG